MAFTYTDINEKIVLHSWGRFKARVMEACAVGDLLALYGTDATSAFQLADLGDTQYAVAVACENCETAADEITCALAVELKAPTTLSAGGVATQTYFCAVGDLLGSQLYLGEDGKAKSTASAQGVGVCTARDTIFLCPGQSVTGAAGSFTTLAASSTLGVSGVATLGNALDASNSTTGGTVVSGGLAVAKKAYIGTNLSVGGTLTATGAIASASTFTAGTTGVPAGDFTLWGTLASAKVWFDVDGDTNGAWYFGANAKGLMVYLYGDTALYNVHWDPSGDTNGAWYFGADAKGVDVAFYGQTASNSMTWDASANALVFVAGGITMGVASKLVLPVKASGSATKGDIWFDTTDDMIHYYATGVEYTITAT